jgi:hypothetical protein
MMPGDSSPRIKAFALFMKQFHELTSKWSFGLQKPITQLPTSFRLELIWPDDFPLFSIAKTMRDI